MKGPGPGWTHSWTLPGWAGRQSSWVEGLLGGHLPLPVHTALRNGVPERMAEKMGTRGRQGAEVT